MANAMPRDSPSADPAAPQFGGHRRYNFGALQLLVPARLDVAEERAALDELGDFSGDHGFPGVVVRGYSPQHVAAEDRQALRTKLPRPAR